MPGFGLERDACLGALRMSTYARAQSSWGVAGGKSAWDKKYRDRTLLAKYPPTNVSGMLTMNHTTTMRKYVVAGTAPVLPVCLMNTLSTAREVWHGF